MCTTERIAITYEDINGPCMGCLADLIDEVGCSCNTVMGYREQAIELNDEFPTEEEFNSMYSQVPTTVEEVEFFIELTSIKLTKEQREFQDYLDSL